MSSDIFSMNYLVKALDLRRTRNRDIGIKARNDGRGKGEARSDW